MKRIISLLIALSFSLFLGSNTSSADTKISTLEEIPTEYVLAMQLQEKPLEAYHTLYNTFGRDENGVYVYPDEFAGTWIDDDKLVIAITDVSKNTLMNYYNILKDYNCIEIKEVEYSLNYLKERAEEVYSQIDDGFISEYGVDVMNNSLKFGYNGDLKEFEQKLKAFTSDLKNEPASYCSEFAESNADLVGGMPIQSGGYAVTLGMCGTSGPNFTANAVVTCGHYMSVGNDVNHNSDTDTSLIGRIRIVNFSENSYGDYAIASVSDSADDVLTNLVKGSTVNTVITDYEDSIPINTVFLKYGNETGFSVRKVVDTDVNTNVRINPTTTVRIKGLTKGSLLSGLTSADGDSGGPIFYTASGTNYFVGVHSSGNSTTNMVYFTPYQYFSDDFIPKTTS